MNSLVDHSCIIRTINLKYSQWIRSQCPGSSAYIKCVTLSHKTLLQEIGGLAGVKVDQ